MKTVFITRNLAEKSVFKKLLEQEGFEVFGESMIQFSAIPFGELPKTDWIFFYSKNGVKYFFQGIKDAGLEIPENVKWAAIGPETAKLLAFELKEPDFLGTGNPKQTAHAFSKIAGGQKVLFPQAESSLQSIQQLLENEVIAMRLAVYKNIPKEKITIPYCEYLAFTSPLNAKVYFKKKPFEENQNVFAIGKTTSKALDNLGITGVKIAEFPSEEGLAKTIIKSLKSKG